MTDLDPEPKETALKPQEVLWELAWCVVPVSLLIASVKVLQYAFPSADTALLLVSAAVPEAALLYAFILWRRR